MSGQRRGTAIAMTDPERDTFLRTQPLCRVATVGRDGDPHVSALWFAWDGSTLWLNSLVRSQRWTDLDRDPRLSVIVDDGGKDFMALRGVELRGSIEVVGEAPRKGDALDELVRPEQLFADKYMGGGTFRYDGKHGWLRLTAEKVVSWDFAKLRRDR
ncbi:MULTISPECIES: pyridoxamine 5'-phosphate oxidase family protein [Streptomyces]|uniref:pyridoxamine 5'-phosphate oxidase family protein n=1 Tax=Streptomyces TaxID=1883 RepID=UPI001162E0F3|nr:MULTISPECIES: pyridoxamine 5'-phosphate oxidase family protein [Streptomyces]MCX4614830.1 pyridoxamine 5'-phosphate oxidase family protein [Streptomyces mirabilis]NMI55594.1 pyridoxamine 5'-phosphate oxidase family protein [Streptomyces sp. RLA2-12]QDN55094.1 pyridoxamine 5'-phosphate oxidase family protein [Streptomyces sp. S1D4-20]QDN65273.1 pyridoxamine 5'-phosphate oxidase family protein [Streptomyces sp. S1D4-14]QDN85290.1 pyridoxamine 5'-phosphate oxidase family protein [Streptomyces 